MSDAEIGGVIVGLTEVIKNLGIPSKYCPAIAVLLGVGLAVYDGYTQGQTDYVAMVIRGVVLGATTTGLYAATGNMVGKASSPSNNGNYPQETY